MACLFCGGIGPYSTEHPIPESLGGNIKLENRVCTRCNGVFAKLEQEVLDKTLLGFSRVLMRVRTKKRKMPSINTTLRCRAGETNHTPIRFRADDTGALFLDVLNDPDGSVLRQLGSGKLDLQFVITAKMKVTVGRFLAKVALGTFCHRFDEYAYRAEYDLLREFARYGSTASRRWPFYFDTVGSVADALRARSQNRIGRYHFAASDGQLWFALEHAGTWWALCMSSRNEFEIDELPEKWGSERCIRA